MRYSIVRIAALCALVALFPAAALADTRPITARDLWELDRIGSLALSPDGRWAAIVVTDYDVEKNEGQGDIWLVAVDGSGTRRFTTGPTTEGSPAWSPDGSMLAFTAKREGEKAQLHVIPLDGGEARAVTDMPLGASNPHWLPDGRRIAFVSRVLPGFEANLDSMRAEIDRRAESKVTAKETEDRFYRYWDHWLTDGYVPHLFVVDVETRETTDLMPGWDRLCSSGGIDFDVSPDGGEIAFGAFRHGSPYDSLEADIYLLDLERPGEYENITPANPADDFSPYYTPDGEYILYGAQKTIGFYGDRVRLVRFDRKSGERTLLTEDFDRSPGGWRADAKGRIVYFSAEDRAMTSIFSVPVKGGAVKEIFRGGTNSSVYPTPKGRLVFLHQSLSQPTTVCSVKRDGSDLEELTTEINGELLAGIEWAEVEDVTFAGWNGRDVQMFVLLPPGFDPSRKWPLLVLVHGGPHGTFGDYFHYRWNAQAFAAPGYVTACVNFHGSSSFGQDFTDAITGEHGRKPYEDVMKAVDLLVGRGYIDESRMGVAGGSYGGYLVSWIGTQTDRFACIINHAGVFDLCVQFGSDITHGRERSYGGQPWDGLENILRWSPAHHMENYVTPTLVVHGEKDYRVPVGNGLECYGMLKAKGVPAKLVYFPDENHWVLTAHNSLYWYDEFHGWLERWIGVGPGEGE